MDPVKEPEVYRVPISSKVVVWIGFFAVTLVPSYAFFTEHDKAALMFATILGSIIGLWALKVTLWRVTLSQNSVSWRKFFRTKTVSFSDIQSFESEDKHVFLFNSYFTGNVVEGYFVVNLKSGARLRSTNLGTEFAFELAGRGKSLLSALQGRL